MNSISGIKNFYPLASGDCTNQQWIIYTLSSHSLLILQFFIFQVSTLLMLMPHFYSVVSIVACLQFPVPEPWQTFEMSVNEYLGWSFIQHRDLTRRNEGIKIIVSSPSLKQLSENVQCSYMNVCMQYILHNRKMTLGIPFHAVSAL